MYVAAFPNILGQRSDRVYIGAVLLQICIYHMYFRKELGIILYILQYTYTSVLLCRHVESIYVHTYIAFYGGCKI